MVRERDARSAKGGGKIGQGRKRYEGRLWDLSAVYRSGVGFQVFVYDRGVVDVVGVLVVVGSVFVDVVLGVVVVVVAVAVGVVVVCGCVVV